MEAYNQMVQSVSYTHLDVYKRQALVGPVTFLGLLVANVTREMMKTYKHSYLIAVTMLVSIFALVFGQLMIERILHLTTPVSVIIDMIGGIYFMYLLYKESRI